MIPTLDVRVFTLMNGLAGRDVATDAIFIFGANKLIVLMAALVIAYVAVSWKTDHFEGRFENMFHVGLGAALALATEVTLGFLWFRPRPFVTLPDVVKLIEKSPLEKSFPSGHASVAFALAFGVWLHNKKWGWLMLALAACVGLSRIFVGVHYPSDVLGGIVVGYVCARLAAPIKKGIEPYLEFLPVFRKYKKRNV